MNEPPLSLREGLVRAAEALGEAIERDPLLANALRELAEAWGRVSRPGAESVAEYLSRDTDGASAPAQADAPVMATRESMPDGDPAPPDHPAPPASASAMATATSPPPASRAQLDELVAAFSGMREGPDASPSAGEVRVPAPRAVSPRLIAERCRLKQRACELVAELAEAPEYRAEAARENTEALIRQAKALEDCYLWMLRAEAREWVPPEKWETLGHCFANLARAMVLAEAAAGEDSGSARDDCEEILALAAEAQRATREAVTPCIAPGRNFEDTDQLAAFRWIAERCDTLRVFVERHMRLDDPADPEDWESLHERLVAVEKRRTSGQEKVRAENQLRGKIRYEAQRLGDAPNAEVDHRAEKIAHAIRDLADLGVPPSDSGIRDLLVPVADKLADAPDFDIDPYRIALRELDRHLARLEAAGEKAHGRNGDGEAERENPDVASVRDWLRGRTVVLIGGDERPDAARRLKDAFGLSELVWVATRPHESTESLQPAILRDEVAVVLLAIRWSSHSFGGVRAYCDAAGKPLVRLPGGYGVNRVAAEIAAQASDALAEAAAGRDG